MEGGEWKVEVEDQKSVCQEIEELIRRRLYVPGARSKNVTRT